MNTNRVCRAAPGFPESARHLHLILSSGVILYVAKLFCEVGRLQILKAVVFFSRMDEREVRWTKLRGEGI